MKKCHIEVAPEAFEGVIRGNLPPDCNPQRVARAWKTVLWTVFTEQRALPPGPHNPCGSKNTDLADLPPGSVEDARGKSVQGVALAGEEFPRQHSSRIHA